MKRKGGSGEGKRGVSQALDCNARLRKFWQANTVYSRSLESPWNENASVSLPHSVIDWEQLAGKHGLLRLYWTSESSWGLQSVILPAIGQLRSASPCHGWNCPFICAFTQNFTRRMVNSEKAKPPKQKRMGGKGDSCQQHVGTGKPDDD